MSRIRRRRTVVASHRRPSTTSPRDWRVGLKLAAVLVIPLLSFLVIAGVQVAGSIATASNLDGFARRAQLGAELTTLVHELQRERDNTAGMLAALSAPSPAARDVGPLAPQWATVDQATARLRSSLAPLSRDDTFSHAWSQADTLLADLPLIREGASKGWLRASAAFDTYTRTIAGLLALLPTPPEVGGDAEVARAVRGVNHLAQAKELTAQLRGQLFMVCSAGGFEPEAYDRVADVRARAQSSIEQLRVLAAPAQVELLDEVITGQAVATANRLTRTILGSARGGELGVDAKQWWTASTTQLELMRAVEQGMLERANVGVQAATGEQWRTTVIGSLAVVALLAVAVWASVAIGRSMASALRALREQALYVAQDSLPGVIEQLRLSPTTPPPLRVDAVVVNSRDEIGEVATAFTAVHRSAVRLAAEQANMRRNVNEIFIKLARRSQTLVERQLKLLDTMESTETDPNQLANLFRLDHLATRLRRNDENLLVLAEGDTIRGWDQPVELTTVVMAATAEIEHYTRVRSEIAETVHIKGFVITDLVHLVAELLENATQFSPPESRVTIAGESTVDGGAQLSISDTGIGMASEAIDEANTQLARPMSIDVSAAERMGLVVVAHLAKRHGIGVRLETGAPGTLVRVTIPARLVAEAPTEQTPPVEPARFLRSEDVLSQRAAAEDSGWWSKDAPARANSEPKPDAPKEVTEVTSSGLPKRNRVKTRTTEVVADDYHVPPEVDPEQTASMLTSLFSGGTERKDET